MFLCDEVCFTVSRLTPPQRSVLARLPAATSATYLSPTTLPEIGILRGLYQLDLALPHPAIASVFRRTLLGDAIMEVLADTEAVADAG